ncbi:hypothetical protein GWN26_10705, partial [Candidatus Saccharibacteria bacterium]|nr:hypothetical protein [Candidatus Saccharibacteria bacterium]NIS38629.1 hypothetical protein [Candidatus Saccharibacteria bacterium]NIV10960.1 hypothetical protein [Fodinibius sp.]NIV99565.1 hypothetical protein [Candidatus Saccharibacteria bacterium]
IVGCSDSKTLAPFNDSNYEFWGVNNLFVNMPDKPWTRWFEIHEITHDGKHFKRREHFSQNPYDFRGQPVDDYIKGLGKLTCPVYMQKRWPNIPNSVVYPLKEIIEAYGNYFTNTVSYEIALAIFEGFKTIGIYGVDMAVGSEYGHQRPSCEYFIGLAIGLGIEVYIPPEADLLKIRHLYAFEENKEAAWLKKVRSQIESMKTRLKHSQQQLKTAETQVNQYIGAISAAQEQIKIWGF